VLLLIRVLDEEKKALSGLAGPSNDGVGDLGLLAAKVLAQVVRGDGLLSEPEVLLGKAESTATMVSMRLEVCFSTPNSLLQTRRLVAQSTTVDGLDDLLFLFLYWSGCLGLSLWLLLGLGCLDRRGGIVTGKDWRGRGLNRASLGLVNGQVNGLGGFDGRHVNYCCL
jgi:hypothetical protein